MNIFILLRCCFPKKESNITPTNGFTLRNPSIIKYNKI